ncbi:hypothetical protein BDN72DRAFT_842002 [Pluteus cervinus]|uniref:Uncharacterized protein n=1 Tax=Pluteus cervinus TaxID=181527 RepID=A0ACD3ASM6_9AGAR|nr:hypothetical protein BDN72DRAFT_842002 [Pluteus cervinus]
MSCGLGSAYKGHQRNSLADVALSVCPGFNYGIGNALPYGLDNRWNIYDDSCNIADTLIIPTSSNPCATDTFGCSPPPLYFNKYKSTRTNLIYDCRPDPNSGVCGNDAIAVCCRNDGH